MEWDVIYDFTMIYWWVGGVGGAAIPFFPNSPFEWLILNMIARSDCALIAYNGCVSKCVPDFARVSHEGAGLGARNPHRNRGRPESREK